MKLRAALRIIRGDNEQGVADLQTMIRLTPKDFAATFAESPKPAVTGEALEHGKHQVAQLLKDRPVLSQYGEKAKVLYDWTARQFAGEKLHEKIRWDAAQPILLDAEHLSPNQDRQVAFG